MVTSSEKLNGMLGSRPENISLSVPKERIDYTLVEEMFTKLATDDPDERKDVLTYIAKDILAMAKSELHRVKLFLSTILRLAHRTPFFDVSESMLTLLGDLETLGLQVPRIRFLKGPSFYIPKDKVPRLDDQTSEAFPTFKDAFLNDARVSHMVQVMGFHPRYLEHWVKAHHYLMRECKGALPRHHRAYIAILASARHNCLYTVNLFEREFQCFGGDQEWLKGLDNAPKKIQNLIPINNILCHKPWALTQQHLQDLLVGPDSWSRPELAQALTIVCHTHALTAFVLGCSLTHEIDSSAGHTYGNSPQIDIGVEDQLAVKPDKNGDPVTYDDIYMRLIQDGETSDVTQDVNQQHFSDLIEQQSINSSAARPVNNALLHYMRQPEAEYEICNDRIYGEELGWEEMGYPCSRDCDEEMAELLNTKFQVIQKLTYNTFGGKAAVDTSKLRSSVWYYVQSLWGIYYWHVDYGVIQELLPPGFREFISNTSCTPENLKQDFFNWESNSGFTHSEKVHFCLIIMEARFQAEFCFALKALD